MKKQTTKLLKILIIVIAVLITILNIGKVSLIERYKISKQITVSISDKLEETDIVNKSYVYHREYKQYALNNEYKYYTCVVKIENNSDYCISDVNFSVANKGDYRIDFDSSLFEPFGIIPNTTEYVACIISVSKDVAEEHLNDIVGELPRFIHLYFTNPDKEDVNYLFSLSKTYTVCDINVPTDSIQYHHDI